jgi:peptide deformylase
MEMTTSSGKFTLVQENNPVLRQDAELWDFENPIVPTHELLQEMRQLMLANNGVGLAAPQVGLSTRLFVMGDSNKFIACFNPKIIEFSEEQVKSVEGCLSFPGLLLPVARSERVAVSYIDANGKQNEEWLDGLWARCFQHETDHLNGICFVQQVSKMVLNIAERKRRKIFKGK